MILLVAATASAQEVVDYRDHVDQARFYLKKSWYADALTELEAAAASPDGRLDAEVWFLLAQTRYALGELSGARYAADRAFVNSRTPDQASQSRELAEHLDETFGVLRLLPPRDSVTTRIDLELESRLLDPELKRWVTMLQERLDDTTTLPLELGLPAGTYVVNGAEVTVRGGEETELVPPIDGRGLAWQTLRIELSAGASGWLGKATASMLPAATTGLAVSAPLGSLEVGLVADWTPTAIALASGEVTTDLQSFAGGVRVGLDLGGDEALRIRPALSWRYGQLPGVQVPCRQPSESGYVCGRSQGPGDLFVVPRSRVHRPAAELGATWLPRARRGGIGGGLRLVTEAAFGQLPSTAEARVVSTDKMIPYETVDRSWTALGLRLLVDLTIAL